MSENESDGSVPEDPVSVLSEGMTQLHEMFLSMRAAGFTEAQACRIIGVFMAGPGTP